ncbi:hypothetical protein BCAR13_70015 [Paraburkholderia caribensis]|nr:hypothetical protein BCAR13_70015 [Paraburkholderia caribensis]
MRPLSAAFHFYSAEREDVCLRARRVVARVCRAFLLRPKFTGGDRVMQDLASSDRHACHELRARDDFPT